MGDFWRAPVNFKFKCNIFGLPFYSNPKRFFFQLVGPIVWNLTLDFFSNPFFPTL